MRRIATILLLWPISVFGALFTEQDKEAFIATMILSEMFSSDAPPPHGIWECEVDAGFSCSWEDYGKDPECEAGQDSGFEETDSILSRSFRIDLESSPYTATIFSEKGEPLNYLGPEKSVWTLAHDEVFIDWRMITVLNPRKGTFKQTWIELSAPLIRMGPFAEYVQLLGTCTNINPKESEKPEPEGGDKEESPGKGQE